LPLRSTDTKLVCGPSLAMVSRQASRPYCTTECLT
jgi:hypothetical protein